jgi:branched-chain amino acid transport system substrate-binding protein
MYRRTMMAALAASAVLVALGPTEACAQEPIVFGAIVPLSPPGETALGQLVKRGAELGVDYLNEKGGVLGRKVTLSVQDSAGKNEQGVAAYRRLVSQEKAVAVFGFVHSGVNIAVNEVAKEMGVPTMGTQTGAGDVTAKKYPIAFRTHAVDPPRAATWLGWIKKNNWKRVAILAETTDYGIGLAKETEKQNKDGNLGLEIQTIMFDRTTTDLLPQLLQIKAFKPNAIVNVGVGQPLELMITQAHTVGLLPDAKMVTSYDAPARPQFWQIHGDKGVGMSFIAFYSPKSELSDLGKWFAKKYQEKYNEAPVYGALNGFGNAVVFGQAIEKAKSTDPKAIIEALETGSFTGWSAVPVTFPKADGPLWHNWSPPLMVVTYTAKDQTVGDATVAYTLGK